MTPHPHAGAKMPEVPHCETPNCPNFVESGETKCTDCLDRESGAPAPLTRKQIAALAKVFASEVEAALAKHGMPFQSKAKIYGELAEQGLLYWCSTILPGRFPVTVEGWALTHAGRIAYCAASKEDE